ncbi:MAG: hypothetical protein HOV80_28505 [Polyangiaceae bacterium]|nr:hypothetical protein [Polyangiaceae bacterium]
MYISLDRIDVQLSPRDGKPRLIQTDHRLASEVAERPGLSTIAALIRCLNPRRMYPDAEVFYSCAHEPPAFLREAVMLCGAAVVVGDDLSVVERPFHGRVGDAEEIDRVANAALDGLVGALLSDSTSSEFGLLVKREAALFRDGFPSEDDDVRFWTAVLELGALAGSAVRMAKAGSWFYDREAIGTTPFNFRCSFDRGPATANLFGKAVKFLRACGGGDEPSALVKLLVAKAS